MSTFSLFGMPVLPVGLNKGELVLQLCVELSSSVLNKYYLLWLGINKEEINTEAVSVTEASLANRKRLSKA